MDLFVVGGFEAQRHRGVRAIPFVTFSCAEVTDGMLSRSQPDQFVAVNT